jgi:hypothetical protein
MASRIPENSGAYPTDLPDSLNTMEETKEVLSRGGWARISKGGLHASLQGPFAAAGTDASSNWSQ